MDVKVRLSSGVRPSQVQALLDDQISHADRNPAKVLLEELDGEDLVVRVQATPERAGDGAKLADEIIAVLASVTGEHQPVTGDPTESADRTQPGGRTEPADPPQPAAAEPTGGRSRARTRAGARPGSALVALTLGQVGGDLLAAQPRLPVAASCGAIEANAAPSRSASGATSTSARLRSIARITAAATSSGESRPRRRGELDAGVGEHPGVADEAGQDHRDADPVGAQIRAQPEREAAQAELCRRVDR